MRIALSTGGGDAPGLNAVIRAATFAARRRGWEVVGIRDGFNGLMFPEHYPDGSLAVFDFFVLLTHGISVEFPHVFVFLVCPVPFV